MCFILTDFRSKATTELLSILHYSSLYCQYALEVTSGIAVVRLLISLFSSINSWFYNFSVVFVESWFLFLKYLFFVH